MALTTAMAVLGAAAIGAGSSAIASSKAAKAQRKAAEQAQQTAKDTFDKQAALQEPFRQGGLTAQNKIMELLGIGGDATSAEYGSAAKAFGNDQFQQDPGYAFRQSEGMKALERSAAARGGLMSGSAMKGIQRFGQNLASQEYQNAFNRYQIERSARLNPLQSMMGSGQSAANVVTGAAGTEGQNIAAGQMNAGQARASGYIGASNALNQALGSVSNYAANQPLQNAMINYYGNPAGGGYGGMNVNWGSPAPTPTYNVPGLNPYAA